MSDKIYKLDDARLVCLNIFDFITEEGRTSDEIMEALLQLYERAEINGSKRILVESVCRDQETLKFISGETRQRGKAV
jgi:hypothetical protein